MNTNELAHDFAAMLKNNQSDQAAAKFNADNIVSYEAMDGPMSVCQGKEAVQKKSEWWAANHEVHNFTTEGPFVNGDQFALRFHVDVTAKESGKRIKMDEIGLYHVENGKIVSERFFFGFGRGA